MSYSPPGYELEPPLLMATCAPNMVVEVNIMVVLNAMGARRWACMHTKAASVLVVEPCLVGCISCRYELGSSGTAKQGSANNIRQREHILQDIPRQGHHDWLRHMMWQRSVKECRVLHLFSKCEQCAEASSWYMYTLTRV